MNHKSSLIVISRRLCMGKKKYHVHTLVLLSTKKKVEIYETLLNLYSVNIGISYLRMINECGFSFLSNLYWIGWEKAPPLVDFMVSWLASTHRFIVPLIFFHLNKHFRRQTIRLVLGRVWNVISVAPTINKSSPKNIILKVADLSRGHPTQWC